MIYLEHFKEGSNMGLKYQYEDISTCEFEMINQSGQETIIPVAVDSGYFKYTTTSLIPLRSYFQSQCHEIHDIEDFIIKLVDALAELEHFLLHYQKVFLHKDYIFLSNDMQRFQFIYIPDTSVEYNIHEQVKETLLFILLNHPSFKYFYQKNRFKKLLSWLQDEHFDCFVCKSLINNELPVKAKSKNKWKIRDLFKAKAAPLETETIMLSYENNHALIFDEKKLVIDKRRTTIGRSQELTDFSLPEVLSMGRVHAEIIREKNSVYIVDLNSKNGTFVNGIRIDSQNKKELHKGDIVKFASQESVFE